MREKPKKFWHLDSTHSWQTQKNLMDENKSSFQGLCNWKQDLGQLSHDDRDTKLRDRIPHFVSLKQKQQQRHYYTLTDPVFNSIKKVSWFIIQYKKLIVAYCDIFLKSW